MFLNSRKVTVSLRSTWSLLLVVLATTGSTASADESTISKRSLPPIHGILYNEDDSNRFNRDPAGKMKPERLDQMVDELADSQVSVMLLCCNARRTCYQSNAWDVFGEGFAPAKDDQQPFFGDTPKEMRPIHRQRAHNIKVLLDAGVCPMQRMIDRCRQRGISPWISIRMNDVHEIELLKSPMHSRFWLEHPECWRYPDGFRPKPDRHLNYGMKAVRDNMMSLIREVCDRFDVDGLELDWVRFPTYFRQGEEAKQSKVLTQWIAEVREVVRAAEKKRHHSIYLTSRVPARPEVSLSRGLDAVAWAKQGLVDHLTVSPIWTTTDYDVPIERWNELLEGTVVGVTVAFEDRVQPSLRTPAIPFTPERRRGAAMAALGRGSQGVYLFNHFGIGRGAPGLLKEMGAVDTLANKDRSYLVTFADIGLAGKPIPTALPKKLAAGKSAEFSLFIGPKPLDMAQGKVLLTLKAAKPGEKCVAAVTLNGQKSAQKDGIAFDAKAFCEGYNTIQVVNAGKSEMTVEGVELSLKFPQNAKDKTRVKPQ